MAEVIVFPDVEDELRVWLAAALGDLEAFEGVAVYATQKPATLPSRFVYLRRTGGSARDMVTDLAQITVECYGGTTAAAERLTANVRGLLHSLGRIGSTGSMTVHDVAEFAAPYFDPDPLQPERFRYTATFQVATRGNVL